MPNTRIVYYVRELEVGSPILNPEKTSKMVTMAFRRETDVAIKINGKELKQLNYYVDDEVYRISKDGEYSIYSDSRMDHDDYRFLVNSGETYQVIASVGPLSWIESEYTPEVSE